MKTITSIKQMQNKANQLRGQGDRIGFVPTMGFLHEGHLSLMRTAEKENDILVVSIFVNPTQFGPGEDFQAYPRDLDRDARLCREAGTDILFVPSADEMYPENFRTTVEVSGLTEVMCGLSRPGHFTGVTTIVAKLFATVKPRRAYFGLKDYQQYKVISRMADDLNMGVEVVGISTVREPDGLAMSSRNAYLSDEERKSALALYRSFGEVDRLLQEGVTRAAELKAAIRDMIESEPHTTVDYVQIVDPENLSPLETVDGKALLALAVEIGKARLIDNAIIG